MKKFLFLLLTLLLIITSTNAMVLQAEVSVNEVPKALFGTWRINARLDKTNSYEKFKAQSVDYWTLSRTTDVISLANPFTGANATISVNAVEGNLIIFTRKSTYSTNQVLTDTVSLRLDENKFSGINELKLESFSLVDNHLMNTETAVYRINGEKLSGEGIVK